MLRKLLGQDGPITKEAYVMYFNHLVTFLSNDLEEVLGEDSKNRFLVGLERRTEFAARSLRHPDIPRKSLDGFLSLHLLLCEKIEAGPTSNFRLSQIQETYDEVNRAFGVDDG